MNLDFISDNEVYGVANSTSTQAKLGNQLLVLNKTRLNTRIKGQNSFYTF